jgi:hypothetical protein
LGQPSKEGEVVDDDLAPRLHRCTATRRPMARSPQMPRMDEHVARRLWRSSMGRSEVVVRWMAISICTSIGSTVSDIGCRLAAMIAGVDRGTTSGRRRAKGLERHNSVTYID